MKETEKEKEEGEEEREYEQCTKSVMLIYTAHSPHHTTPHHTTPHHTTHNSIHNRLLHAHSPSSLFECLEDLQKGHVVSVAVSELAHTLHVFLLRLHASRMP